MAAYLQYTKHGQHLLKQPYYGQSSVYLEGVGGGSYSVLFTAIWQEREGQAGCYQCPSSDRDISPSRSLVYVSDNVHANIWPQPLPASL